MNRSLKHLSFESLRHCLTLVFRDLPDRRQVSKIRHRIHDVVMSGFAMMYFQDRSLLQFQKRQQRDQGGNNLRTIFGVEKVPEDTQMREILDNLDRDEFRPAFNNFVHRLQRAKYLEKFKIADDSVLCVIDGTEYFSSETIHCAGCVKKKHKDKISYSHLILQGAIVHPSLQQVIPLMPEEIRNTDGFEKQDCEINAGKRFIQKLRKDHPQMKITIGGDGLNSKEPMIEMIRALGMGFVLVAKPDDHKFMMEWFEEQKNLGEASTKIVEDEQGRKHIYEWLNGVPLTGKERSASVNL